MQTEEKQSQQKERMEPQANGYFSYNTRKDGQIER